MMMEAVSAQEGGGSRVVIQMRRAINSGCPKASMSVRQEAEGDQRSYYLVVIPPD